MIPVRRRIIQPHLQPSRPHGLDKRPHQIPLRPVISRMEVTRCRRPQRKAVMMSGGQHHIPHSRFFRQGRPRRRIIIFRTEIISIAMDVVLLRDAFAIAHPLATGRHRIDAPVNKHAIPRFVEPFVIRIHNFLLVCVGLDLSATSGNIATLNSKLCPPLPAAVLIKNSFSPGFNRAVRKYGRGCEPSKTKIRSPLSQSCA